MNHIGVGVGYRPVHYSYLESSTPEGVDWFEIISENFMGVGGKPRQRLYNLRRNFPVAMHGVGLSIANTSPIDSLYLSQLKQLMDWLEPSLVTDHLVWTSHRKIQSYDLLPFPYTKLALKHIANRVLQVQDYLGRSILLENPSVYIDFCHHEMSEFEFMNELAAKTGCGILLDLNNLCVNKNNIGIDPWKYLNGLSQNIVGQFHLGGHLKSNDIYIDTHDHPVPEEAWELYKFAVSKWPNAPTLVEWDEKIPDFPTLAAEAQKARSFAPDVSAQGGAIISDRPHLSSASENKKSPLDLQEMSDFQSSFLDLIRLPAGAPLAQLQRLNLKSEIFVPPSMGFGVYHSGYFLRIFDSLKETFATLFYIVEEPAFRKIVADFIVAFPPQKFSLNDAGEAFPEYLKTYRGNLDLGVETDLLTEIATLDWIRSRIFLFHGDSSESLASLEILASLTPDQWENLRININPAFSILSFNYDIDAVWQAVHKKQDPEVPQKVPQQIIVYRRDHEVYHQKIAPHQSHLLTALKSDSSFLKACQTCAPHSFTDEKVMEEVMASLAFICQLGLVCSAEST